MYDKVTMKTAIVASLIASATAFAPASNGMLWNAMRKEIHLNLRVTF